MPRLFLYQWGIYFGLTPLPVPLSSFRNFSPILRYDFTFNLAFTLQSQLIQQQTGTLEKEEVYSSRFDFFPLFWNPPVCKNWFLFQGLMEAILLG